MSATKLKPLYIRVPQMVAPALLVIGLGAYMRSNPRTSRSYLSRQCRSLIVVKQAFTELRSARIDVIAVSDGTVGLGLTKELIQNSKPGEVERLLAQHFEKSPVDASVNAFLIKY